jgi:hypothetical protein
MGTNRELWSEYRVTWASFSRDLDRLQKLAESGQKEAAATALLEVEKSRLRHNEARDRLAERLSDQVAVGALPVPEEHQIRRTARLLWEFSGKKENSAESDWQRAEELVRSAGA